MTQIYQALFRESPGRFATGLVRNVGLLATAEALAGIVAFPVRALAGRVLGPEEFGRYALVLSVVQLLTWPMLLSVTTGTLRYLPAEPERADEIVSTVTLTFAIATGLSVAGLAFTGRWWLPPLGVGVDLLCWTLALGVATAAYSLWEAVVRGLHRYGVLAIATVLGALTLLAAFGVAAFALDAGTSRGLIAATGLSLAVPVGLFVASVRRHGVRFRLSWDVGRRVLQYSGLATLGGLTGAVITGTDRIVLQRHVSLEQVGVYAAYVTAASLLAGKALQVWTSVYFPMIAGERDKVAVLRRLGRAYSLAVGPFFVCSVTSIVLIIWLLGEEFPLRWDLTLLLGLNNCLVGFYQMYMWLLNAEGILGIRAVVQALTLHAAVTLVLLALLVPALGAVGAAAAGVSVSASLCIVFHRRTWSFVRAGVIR